MPFRRAGPWGPPAPLATPSDAAGALGRALSRRREEALNATSELDGAKQKEAAATANGMCYLCVGRSDQVVNICGMEKKRMPMRLVVG